MNKLLLAVALLVSLALGACGNNGEDVTSREPGNSGTEPAPNALTLDLLQGRTFLSQEVTGKELAEGSVVRLSFDKSNMALNAGCNTTTGVALLDAGVLKWADAPASTMMGCEQDLMDQDQWLTAWLSKGAEASLIDDEPSLSGDGIVIKLMDKKKAIPDRELTSTKWSLETIISNEAASSVPSEVETPTLEIGDDSKAFVFTGCNRGSSTVAIAQDQTSASFGPLALTKMMCPEGGSEVEAAFTTVFNGQVTLEIDGDQLTVAKADSALVFRAG